MIRLIRERIGFDGLLMSDDIGMEALSGSPAQRAAATIAAGIVGSAATSSTSTTTVHASVFSSHRPRRRSGGGAPGEGCAPDG